MHSQIQGKVALICACKKGNKIREIISK